ncbi:MAG: cellulase family glycosylhydrolase [Sedimentisphaerales bacterium]|nr:cellulase family glycosylhydrolase [Sedimentisphaerales bacterium]
MDSHRGERITRRVLLGGAAAVVAFAAAPREVLARGEQTAAGKKIDFWDRQRKGANFFNRVPAAQRFKAASELGLEFIRLVPDKWESAGRDFLIGSADEYRGLVEADLATLKATLDLAAASGNRVILGMLSLPGARWQQHNDGKQDYRLWNSQAYQAQAVQFWRDLAAGLRGHPAIVAFNPLNEPHPERQAGLDGPEEAGFPDWLQKHRGTCGDLDRFYRNVCPAIREVDPDTPILVEGYGYGSVNGLSCLSPIGDPSILYSFHFYDPWAYTTTRVNKGRYVYPDRMPESWNGPTARWSKANLGALLEPVERWAERHGIPHSRIVAAEFGCGRQSAGAKEYLSDLIALLNEKGYHWAFYSYREDTWDSMDYELGADQADPGGHALLEQGKYRTKPWRDNPLFDVLKKEFRRGSESKPPSTAK